MIFFFCSTIIFFFFFFFVLFLFFFFFFFSSRRRHTRCLSDWSSDVSLPISDLAGPLDDQAETARRILVGDPHLAIEQTGNAGEHHLHLHLVLIFADLQQRLASRHALRDRKSTRLNSSHLGISYAVFCLKKKK